MVDLSNIFIYRMTHIKNIPHILGYGITHSTSTNANSKFEPIGDPNIISLRRRIMLKNGKYLGEYVPFYFGYRLPMLYVIQNGFNKVSPTLPENIVYCISSVQKIISLGLDFVFTDGHAMYQFSNQYTKGDIQSINSILDMNAISSKYWKDDNDLDKKRRKEAEFLVLGDIPVNGIIGYAVYSEGAMNLLIQYGVEASIIQINPSYYF